LVTGESEVTRETPAGATGSDSDDRTTAVDEPHTAEQPDEQTTVERSTVEQAEPTAEPEPPEAEAERSSAEDGSAIAEDAGPLAEPESAASGTGDAAAEPTETTTDSTETTVEATVPAAEPAELERWGRFADDEGVPDSPPAGWLRRNARRVWRFWVHEWTVASVLSLAIAVLMTWPTLRQPTRTIPQDIYDPLLQAWQLAWAGHALLTDPVNLWNGNAFHPEARSYAFSDSLLGYAPFGLLASGPEAAVLRYNVLFVLLHALAFLGGYALLRQLGSRWPGAAVAGAAFGYAPWRLSQAGHMHVLSTGGIALALAMLARGHGWSLRHGYRPERVRAGWAAAGWLVAGWQVTLGFGIGLPFVYVLCLATVVAAVGWLVCLIRRRRRPFPLRMLATDLIGGLIFTGVSLAMAVPYLRVLADHPYARRTEQELAWYSPPLRGYLTAPAESLPWGAAHAPARASLQFPAEMTMLPGLVLLGLAVAGLFLSIWTVRQRILLALGVAGTVALGMGTNFFHGEYGYLLLFRYLPGWDGIRTPGRFIIWTTLLLAVLAAGAVCGFRARAQQAAEAAHVDDRIPTRPALPLRAVMVVPVLLVLAEGLNATPHPQVPRSPVVMREVADPVLVLPSGQLEDQAVMLWSTDGFPRIVNGGSGFIPARLQEVRQSTATFPDPTSISYLRGLGVRTVIVLRRQVAGTPWENSVDAPVDGLGVTRQESGDAVIFTIG
jgi:hypothetical protein